MIIRVDNSRENLIKVYDILQMLGYRCIEGSLDDMLNDMFENSTSFDDLLSISERYLGSSKEVRYVKVSFISKTFKILHSMTEYNGLRVDCETFFTVLRVKRSREEYLDILISLLGSINVPENVERYAREPRMIYTYYIIEDGSLVTYRLYNFESDIINSRKLLSSNLRGLTEEVLEYYSKLSDKKSGDYNNIPS